MVRAGLAVLISSFVLACSSVDPMGTPLDGVNPDGGTASPTGTTPTGGNTCVQTPPAGSVDPAKLPACCNGEGKAHCVPTSMVPASFASQLQACTGGSAGICVPDPFITNPAAVPPSCKSLNNADGICLSVCVPQVAQYKTLLPQATCASDERCAPCISPLDQKPTGACDIGKNVATGGTCSPPPKGGPGPVDAGPPAPPACPHVGPPVLDPSALPSCDPAGGAHCLSASLVPPAMASSLATCPTGLCVPDVFIESGGNFIPPSCRSVNNAEGRCLHEAIPQVAQQKALLPQATCAAFERCVPCFDPLTGKATGACSQSCDPGPKEPPKTFKDCCTPEGASTTQGKCIPSAQVPAAEAKNLGAKECTKGAELCVPAEMIPASFKPNTCSAFNLLSGNYTGVCLSSCLEFGLQGLGISQGDCDDIHRCVPCVNPLNGQPSGAPGCPP